MKMEKTTHERILMFDFHNTAHRTVHIAQHNNPEDKEFIYWKYLMINSFLTQIRKFEPTRVIFTIDEKNNWRKDIYPEYKATRKIVKEKSAIDFEKFYAMMDSFIEELKTVFTNCYFIQATKCEGDDVIATLVERFKGSETILISTDKDFIQLMKFKKFKLYNPLKKQFVVSINPKRDLEIKIIMGDKSDNIPAIKPKTGPKTAEKLLNEGLEELLNSSEDAKNNYERNRRLIDMTMIPKSITKYISEIYDRYELTPFNTRKVWQFMLTNRIRKIADSLNQFTPHLKNLN